jgi:CRISPR-associated protein Csm2
MSKIDFWKDPNAKTIDPTLYSDKAEKVALEISQDHDQSRGKKNKRTQIRKFYDEVDRLNAEAKKIDMKNENWENDWDIILPMVHMLTAKAAYAGGRDLVSENFVELIKTSVGQIEKPKDLNLFANFFEAFMGFYRLHGPKA